MHLNFRHFLKPLFGVICVTIFSSFLNQSNGVRIIDNRGNKNLFKKDSVTCWTWGESGDIFCEGSAIRKDIRLGRKYRANYQETHCTGLLSNENSVICRAARELGKYQNLR